MKFHGKIKFIYIENDGVKKTIGKTILTPDSFPQSLRWTLYHVFPEFNKYGKMQLFAETVCDPADVYDKQTGKDIIRAKIEKKFYSVCKQCANYALDKAKARMIDYADIFNSASIKKAKTIEKLETKG